MNNKLEIYTALKNKKIILKAEIDRIDLQLELEKVYKENGIAWAKSAISAKYIKIKQLKELSAPVPSEKKLLKHERFLIGLDSGKEFHREFSKRVKMVVDRDLYESIIEDTKRHVNNLALNS